MLGCESPFAAARLWCEGLCGPCAVGMRGLRAAGQTRCARKSGLPAMAKQAPCEGKRWGVGWARGWSGARGFQSEVVAMLVVVTEGTYAAPKGAQTK